MSSTRSLRSLRPLLLAALALWLPQAALATGFYTNTVTAGDNDPAPPDNGYYNTNILTGPWTLNHPDPSGGFATSQGSVAGDGTDLAVHAYAVASSDLSRSSESILLTDFQIYHPLGAIVDVTISGSYILEMFGRGIAQVEAWICMGFTNQCQVNQTFLAFLANDAIYASLSPTNESRHETYLWSGTLPSNVPLTLKLRAQASSIDLGGHGRAYVDPHFDFHTDFASLSLDASARLDNPNFIPPVPEPAGLALWLLPAALLARRRTTRR